MIPHLGHTELVTAFTRTIIFNHYGAGTIIAPLGDSFNQFIEASNCTGYFRMIIIIIPCIHSSHIHGR